MSGAAQLHADPVKTAHRLLRVADAQHHFEVRTEQQIRAIIRTYASIVSMEADLDLPDDLTGHINSCYQQVYAWENFEEGLAQILAENLSEGELELLIGFYGNLGLPPTRIQAFKDLIAKSDSIQASSLEFIWANSSSCVEQDARLIREYIAAQTSTPITALSID